MQKEPLTLYKVRIQLARLTHGKWLLDILSEYEDFEATQLEWAGDLAEIMELIHIGASNIRFNANEPGLEALHKVWNIINAAHLLMTPQELFGIPVMERWFEEYPFMCRAMQVWAWG